MGSRAALKLVESPFHRHDVSLWSDESASAAHSLHGLIAWPDAFPAALPSYFINKYTAKGDVVLDPFAGSGTTPLEAKLLGRIALASDLNPVSHKIVRSKIHPGDLTEVTLRLQMANLKRPVDTAAFNRTFSEFFDIATYRELMCLRDMIASNYDRVACFIEAIAMGLLHGHSAGYFSVYTNPSMALSPEAQLDMNLKRSQRPDYRAVVPRILRKAAVVLRDGIHSSHTKIEGRAYEADARNLNYAPDASVHMVVTAPPLPGSTVLSSDQWLRRWFGHAQTARVRNEAMLDGLENWLDFMNEVLFELARVVIPGCRVVLDLAEHKVDGRRILLDEEVQKLVEEALPGYWQCESALIHRVKTPNIEGTRLRREGDAGHRILVLRRR